MQLVSGNIGGLNSKILYILGEFKCIDLNLSNKARTWNNLPVTFDPLKAESIGFLFGQLSWSGIRTTNIG